MARRLWLRRKRNSQRASAAQRESFTTEFAPSPAHTGAYALTIRGRVGHEDAPVLREILAGALNATQGAPLLIELRQLRYIGSSGIAVLLETLQASHHRGQRLLLCSPGEPILRTFWIAGLHEALDACCKGADQIRRKLRTPPR